MTAENSRRNFLEKITAASMGVFLAVKSGFSNKTMSMDNNAVKSVKPMGFQWETLDPFLFCVHHEDFYPKGNENMGPATSLDGRDIGQDFMIKDGWRMYHGKNVPGFPGHPHRGFETITVVRKGMVDHTDSLGAAGRYGNGDVQWMTSGKGLQHAEMFPLIHSDKDNTMELFQIWLNLPSKNKLVEPHFKMLWEEQIPKYIAQDGNGKKTSVEVIAGSIGGYTAPLPPPDSWAFDQNNEVAVWNISMERGAHWTLPKTKGLVNRRLYLYSGDGLIIDNQKLNSYHCAELDTTRDVVLRAENEACNVLILQGKPIGEPVVQHGPFVMNSREEIREAFQEYQKTGFGGWPWPVLDPVHPKTKGRFAKHADGRVEEKA